jgi:hypothetical protein
MNLVLLHAPLRDILVLHLKKLQKLLKRLDSD